MSTINGRACVANGKPVDKVFSDGRQVYGRNLVIGTSNELTTVTGSGWGGSSASRASGTYGAGTYYVSAYIENTTPVDIAIWVSDGRPGNFISVRIPAGQSGIASGTFDISEGRSLISVWVSFASAQTESYTYKYKEMMITRTPTPWTPAPEDVM